MAAGTAERQLVARAWLTKILSVSAATAIRLDSDEYKLDEGHKADWTNRRHLY